ncbi:MAG: efflux RND transporter periplasmic adaptor subunit [Laribacter sp.]|nr:efflux RND transporter periplasmic adaptor subunit [Laribacter sp.]MBP9526757.1 efflux RND transporter periplasmic adaptor subunit [Laribacter sp.]MBP9607770.1 efflux RND transporter periplasmic adaptor subunit [Laribacter sp.]
MTISLTRICLGGLLAATLAGCSDKPAAQEEIRPVRTTRVAATDTADIQRYTAEIRPRHESKQSFRVPGKIDARLVEVGQQVGAGAPLVRLDPADIGLELAAKRAQLAAARSDYTQQQTDLVRYRELLGQQFISQADFDRRQNGVTVAREKLRQAEADLGVSANRQAYTTLTAERAGVVTYVDAEPGQVVQAGQVVVKVAVPGELEAVVNVPEARLAEFRTAEAYTVQLWAGGRQYPAQLRELSPDADAATRTYTARLTLRQPDAEVRLGMSASVAAQGRVPETAVPQLPLSAILDEGGKHYVWVLEGKTPRVKKREVGLGQVDARQAEVRSGVKPGEEIVTAGVHLLRDGMAVRRLASAAPGKPALATGQENGKAGNQ